MKGFDEDLRIFQNLCSGEDMGEFGGGEMSAQNILFENNSFEYKNHTNAGEGKMLL